MPPLCKFLQPLFTLSAINGSVSVRGDSVSDDDLDRFEEALSKVVDHMRSLEKLDAWLRAEEC